MTAADVTIAAMAALPLAITVVNLLTWRSPPAAAARSKISALVPARDEEANIEACVLALLDEPVHEVIVCDDGSTDGTAAILARLADTHPRLAVIRSAALPEGWVGKAHACAQLAAAATGDRLLFVDADVTLARGAVGALDGIEADVVTAFPRQRVGSTGEGIIVPLLHLTYLSWLPLALIARVADPRVLAANGQVLLIRAAALRAVGGFAAVRAAVVDDMALCARAKRAGRRVAFVPGERLATCRMYGSGGEAWRGFSKNLYPGLGSAPLAAGVAALYAACFLLPWLAAPVAPAGAALGMTANVAQRVVIALRFGLPLWTAPLHPLGVVAFLGILANSYRWTRGRAIRWRGRTYAGSAP